MQPNIFSVKGDDVFDYTAITRCFKTFRSGCNNFNDQARSIETKTMDSVGVFRAIQAKSPSKMRKSSPKLASHSLVGFVSFWTSAKKQKNKNKRKKNKKKIYSC